MWEVIGSVAIWSDQIFLSPQRDAHYQSLSFIINTIISYGLLTGSIKGEKKIHTEKIFHFFLLLTNEKLLNWSLMDICVGNVRLTEGLCWRLFAGLVNRSQYGWRLLSNQRNIFKWLAFCLEWLMIKWSYWSGDNFWGVKIQVFWWTWS